MVDGGDRVSFTTKELLTEIRAMLVEFMSRTDARFEGIGNRLGAIEGQMEHRTRASHDHANAITSHEGRLVKIEAQQVADEAVKKHSDWTWDRIMAVILAVIAIASVVINLANN